MSKLFRSFHRLDKYLPYNGLFVRYLEVRSMKFDRWLRDESRPMFKFLDRVGRLVFNK